MTHKIEIDTDRQIATVRYHGEVRVENAPDLLRRIVMHPDWTPQMSRIVDYTNGLLGEIDAEHLRAIKTELVAIIDLYYRGAPHFTANVCADPLKAPIVDFWVSAATGRQPYPAGQARFDTEPEAISWIERMRAAAGQAQPT